ncbi:hypothetical protein B0H14DRAFT_2762108, partial [Mycena olivaceomarginata]
VSLTVRIFGGAVTTLRWSWVFKYALTLPIKLSASQFWTTWTFSLTGSICYGPQFLGSAFCQSGYFDLRNRLYVGFACM